MILTPVTPLDSLDRLESLLPQFPREDRPEDVPPPPMDVPPQAVSLRAAVLGACQLVPIAQAAGRISGGAVGQYPPGIPLICPGEVFTKEIMTHLTRLPPGQRFGMEEEQVWCLK